MEDDIMVRLSNLLAGSEYRYRVRARCPGIGYSRWKYGTFATPALRETATSEIRLLPNPATDFVFILADAGLEIKSYVIYDMLGEVVALGAFHDIDSEQGVDISGLPAGVYFVAVKGWNGVVGKFRVVKM